MEFGLGDAGEQMRRPESGQGVRESATEMTRPAHFNNLELAQFVC